ncbi:MAG: hypothetical protein R3195_07150 [Gemmatimonadota bacterium]|nr:hypothetical protein [Gemmatimonadota bacterium]
MQSRTARTGQTAVPEVTTASDPGASPVPTVSVVVRVTEGSNALEEVYGEYAPAFQDADPDTEFLFAVQPWARPLTEPLRALIEAGEPIRVVEALGGVGEADLLREASELAAADIIVTMPSYHRVQSDVLPKLVQAVRDGPDLVVARRYPRADGWISRLRTRAFNGLLSRLVGQPTSDIGSGVQAMRRQVLEETPLYGDFFRFLPILVQREGFEVAEIDAPQHPRDRSLRAGHTFGVYLRRLVDVLGLFFLIRFTDKPLRFFGVVGGSLVVGGAVLMAILFVQRMLLGQPLADRPILLVAVITFTLGCQAIALGLVGEMIVNLHAGGGRRYRIRRRDEKGEDAG